MKKPLLLSILTALSFSLSAQGQTAPDRGSDKLDIQKLEEKYWSVKDDEFTVVQNRAYTKAKRYFVSLETGRLINDGFSEGSPTSLGVGYFFSEKFGIEVYQQRMSSKNSTTTNSFVTQTGVYPDINRPTDSLSLAAYFVPIYAKVSFLDKKILYFDMSIGLNLGRTNYQILTEGGNLSNSTNHYGVDITQWLFISNNVALRFDIRNKWSTQDQQKYYSSQHVNPNIGKSQFFETTMLFGANIFF